MNQVFSGYIKLHRKITEWEWYSDANTFRVFIHLLLNANYSHNKWQGIPLNPGQRITSSDRIAEDLKLSRQNVRTAINHLKSTGEITVQSTNKFLLVTIENWASYQGSVEESTSNPTSKLTNDQPATNQQLTTNKKDKKEKKNKNEEYSSDFEIFWNHYPRKEEKTAAFKCWLARTKEGHFFEELVNAAKNYSTTVAGSEKRFIKLAKTFIGPNKPFLDYLDAHPAEAQYPPVLTEPEPEHKPYFI